MKLFFAFLAFALFAPSAWAQTSGPTVTIDSGALVGTRSGDVDSFKGIPYAAPPTGERRWMPPELPASWTGQRDATKFGWICPQQKRPSIAFFVGGDFPQNEDCLSLNVWAPRNAHYAPVMVWIHGGGYRFGSSAAAFYDGTHFAQDGVVLVSINYRLGLLGYFAHPAITRAAAPDAPLGNYGQMDQIAALKWVQRNIAAFGGDPSNVTVFGESAGGASTLYLMSTPSARGLFERAIVESGGGWFERQTLVQQEAQGAEFATRAGLNGANATLDQLRALPVETFMDVTSKLGFGPFVDGRLITETPTGAFATHTAMHIPLIIGSNSFEASLMRSFSVPASQVLSQATPAIRAAYKPDDTSDEALAQALFTDSVMGAPAHWVVGQSSAGAPAWLYHFSYLPTNRKGREPGAAHGSEIPFVFRTGSEIAARFGFTPSDADIAMERTMHACWVAFAKTGKPECGTAAWPQFDSASDTLMEFGDAIAPVSHFRQTQYDALGVRMKAMADSAN
jgi:para-nitrobenzyl esterase